MRISKVNLRSLIPLVVLFGAAFILSLFLANEPLSIVSSIMLAGVVSVFSSVHLARAYERKGLGFVPAVAGINFVLTLVAGYFVLRVLADYVVPAWS